MRTRAPRYYRQRASYRQDPSYSRGNAAATWLMVAAFVVCVALAALAIGMIDAAQRGL